MRDLLCAAVVLLLISVGAVDSHSQTGPTLHPAWFIQTSADQGAQGLAVAVDSAGNVLVAGKFSYHVSLGGMAVSSDTATGVDVYVAKLDANGKALWIKRTGGPGLDEVRGIGVDQNNDVVVAGSFA